MLSYVVYPCLVFEKSDNNIAPSSGMFRRFFKFCTLVIKN